MSEITFAPSPEEGQGPTYVRRPPTKQVSTAERARHLAIAATSTLAVVAVIAVLAGYGAKPHRTSLAVSSAAGGTQHAAPAVNLKTQQLQDEEAADDEAAPAEDSAEEEGGGGEEEKGGEDKEKKEGGGLGLPDPEETTAKASEALGNAKDAAGKALDDANKALLAVFPAGDLFTALGWHLDLCFYLITMYIVYYIWKAEVWHKLLPKLKFDQEDVESAVVDDKEKAKNATKGWDGLGDGLKGDLTSRSGQVSQIGTWTEVHDTEVEGPNMQDLLWFRLAAGEQMHFSESERVSPGFCETLMCGCGGNVKATAVTSHRIIVQNDKRCMFGTTVLTTNEESIFLKDIHKASLHTDGSLKIGLSNLHSADMLAGGFFWIFVGFVIDCILEWKDGILDLINDEHLTGWVNMVPNDVIYMFSSVLVLYGAFLFVCLLFFLLFPQSIMEIEFVKQAGTSSYTRKYEFPVTQAYAAYDAIMRGRIETV